MSITLYYGSGSPFAWKVWLALEHKQIPFELKLLSFQAGDLKKPEFLAINPRGKVPALVDDGFVLWESTAIVEYLEDKFPERPLLPRHPQARAANRRLTAEAHAYLYPAIRRLAAQTIFRPKPDGDPAEIAAAQLDIVDELARFGVYLGGAPFFGGTSVSMADFAIYPMVRILRRSEHKFPQHSLKERIPPAISEWMKRVDALPYLEKTTPPHWKE